MLKVKCFTKPSLLKSSLYSCISFKSLIKNSLFLINHLLLCHHFGDYSDLLVSVLGRLPLQGRAVWSVCGGAITHPAAVPRVVPGEGGLCWYELSRSLPGAEHPDPKTAHHFQQVSQRHHRAVR